MEKSEENEGTPAPQKNGNDTENLNLLKDVSVEMSLRLGTCTMTMGEVLQLEAGDIVQMNESIDDPVLLYLNDKVVATGEVVLTDDRLALKIVEILKE
ncbi:MAG: FliM/FliN family flagellar motor C-terminal domain-containing protein [Opitutales bacterium]|nr:FliM/FliN family flagellar motor C-terminal domain-containing protein [Opitutales bacterium]